MCNLYNITTNQEAIRQFTGVMQDSVGNLEPSLDLYPDRPAPVVRTLGNGVRELAKLTWGMPTPEMLLKPGAPDTGVTNVRKTWLPHWQRWLAVANRCVVPATAFCEYGQITGSCDEEEAEGLVRDRRVAAAVRGLLDKLERGAWLDENAAIGRSRAVRVPDLRPEMVSLLRSIPRQCR
jgi:putative SOS response-associated peptidase YedK